MKLTVRNHKTCPDCQDIAGNLVVEAEDPENHRDAKRFTCAICGGDLGEQRELTLPDDLSAMFVALLRRYSFTLFNLDERAVSIRLSGDAPRTSVDRADVLYLRNRILNDLVLDVEIFDVNPQHMDMPTLPELKPVEANLLKDLPKRPILSELVDFFVKNQFVPIEVSRKSFNRYIRLQRRIKYNEYRLFVVRIEIDWQVD